MDEVTEPRKRGPKVGHKKSRNGCHKCKRRRVKCDETQPVCGNCRRLGLDCSWPARSANFASASPVTASSDRLPPNPSHDSCGSLDLTPSSSSSSNLDIQAFSSPSPVPVSDRSPASLQIFSSFDNEPEIDLPESRERRLLEHRLMHHYLCDMAAPFSVAPNKEWSDIFQRTLPTLALKHDNLMNALLAVSAMDLMSKEPDSPELVNARHSYFISAVREQREMLNNLSVHTADPVCLASILLLTYSFASLYDRPLEPYSPPIEWMHMGRGVGAVFVKGASSIMMSNQLENSALIVVLKSHPRLGVDESYFSPDLRKGFEGLLSQELPSGDVWNDETREAYERTLSYVGSIQKAIPHEPLYAVCRRIQGFTIILPSLFVMFVQERRPRALVILAHFFATMAQVQGCVWWLSMVNKDRGGTAEREIRAIAKVVPPEWRSLMVWPLDMASAAKSLG